MNNRLDQLAAPWTTIQSGQSTSQQGEDARDALANIAAMRAQIDTVVTYNRTLFT